jgi:hypothetical protein
MRSHDRTDHLRALRQHWRRWTEAVELFARCGRRRRRPHLDDYESLHRELLAACRALAAASEGPRRTYYEGLEELAGPWLTCRVLERTDRDILVDLLFRCRQVDAGLNGWTWLDLARRWHWLAAFLLAMVALAGVLGVTADRVLFPLGDWLADRWRALRPVLSQWTEPQGWIAAGIVAVLVAMYLLSRTARS